MKNVIQVLFACCLALIISPVLAQDTPPESITNYRQTLLYAGPGIANPVRATLQPDTAMIVIERNEIGNWVHVTHPNGAALFDGWVITGHLRLPDDFNLGDYPAADVPATNPDYIPTFAERKLFQTPVIPPVTDMVREIYLKGQEMDNLPFVAVKVGDSVVANNLYLLPMRRADFRLGPYAYLQDTLLYFGPMMDHSVAARKGMSSIVVFDPFWANGDLCQPNETPLACEYRQRRPAVSLIMFGPNDVRSMSVERFNEQMSRVVVDSINSGVIPVLFTFTSHPNAPYYEKTIEFNNALVDIAEHYQTPLVNLWLASRVLPDYGLDVDRIHLRNSGSITISYEDGQEAYSGVALYNLLSLRMLHELRVELGFE